MALMAQGGDRPEPGLLEKARAAYRQAFDLDAQNFSALFHEGEILEWQGKTDQARKDFQL
ncbi:MAG: hypothetical protein ACP5E5_14700 [Acidobacteriaceae bacterium]